MPKNNFLLVDLNESKTKKLAETITSTTSRKILNHLTEKEDSEANIAKHLNLPISTVHYHLQKLVEANLVVVEEFHYSPKGREVNHYKLANKYIIIAPKKVSGLKEKLRGILPVAIACLGIGAVIKLVQKLGPSSMMGKVDLAMESAPMVAKEVGSYAAITTADEAKKVVLDTATEEVQREVVTETANQAPIVIENMMMNQPDIAFWFLVGSLSAIAIYVLIVMIREWRKKR